MILKYVVKNKASILFYLATILLLIYIGFFRLSYLMPGIAKPELASSKLILGWHGIQNNPLNLIINIVRSIIYKFATHKTAFDIRLPSVILGLSSMIGFYFLLKSYYGHKTAIIGSFLFDCTSLLLHLTRFGANGIEYVFSAVLILLINSFISKKELNKYIFSFLIFSLLIVSFNPGMVWLIVLGFIINFREYLVNIKKLKNFSGFLVFILSILMPLALLIWYVIKSPLNIFSYLSIPVHNWNTFNYLKDIVLTLKDIFVFNSPNPALWLGQSPVLDILALLSLIIGSAYLLRHFKSSRVKLIYASILLSILLIALNRNSITIGLVLPFLYIIITVGITYLLQAWYKVFPFNPVARFIGLSLIILIVFLSCLYNLRSYFVAWAYNPTSRSAFYIKD